MRLFVDQNLPLALAGALSIAGHDVVHAQDVEMARAEDPEILKRCCAEGRTLITADKKLTKYLVSSGTDCPSVLVLRGVRTLRSTEIGVLVLANLARIEAAVERQGNAVFTMAPDRPIRAVTLPLV